MTVSPFGPQTAAADRIHQEKYRGSGETFRAMCQRVAGALADNDNHYHAFREALMQQRFCPAGRIQASVGSSRQTTSLNCFVSGVIADSFVDGEGSIMARAHEAVRTMRLGGGIGYDFSTLRPRGASIKSLESTSSGPVSMMEIFDAGGRAVSSSGHRRGAQMGVLSVSHPNIEEFIHVKQNEHKLTGFNISIAVTDAFMEALINGDEEFPLTFNGQVHRTINPTDLWNLIMQSTYDYAEPGVLFIDRINQMNNLHYCETIAATNPCGEVPLPPHGACLLGSFNLVKYLVPPQSTEEWTFDIPLFKHDIAHVVRAMDNIIDHTIYPLPEQEAEEKNKRRMGLGVMGVANAIERLGHPYGSPQFLEWLEEILTILRDEAYRTSINLAQEKGAFPLFVAESYGQSRFIQTLPTDIQVGIQTYGIRNSHLLSIAPTGTISQSADNVSSGIEPVFALRQERVIADSTGQRIEALNDYGVAFLDWSGKTADQVTPDEHVAVLALAQRYVDSAVSKTCNVPTDIPYDEFKDLYLSAWKQGCKGCTTYRVGGKRGAILKAAPSESQACTIDPLTGNKSCSE